MMLRCLLLVALVSAFAHGHSGGGYESLLQKCGLRKIYESCFGERLAAEKTSEFYGHLAHCTNKTDSRKRVEGGFNWQAALNEGSGGEETPFYLPVPIITDSRRKSPFFNSRGKRHAMFDEKKLRKLKNNVIDKLKIASCVLQRYNFMDQEMNVNWNTLREYYTKDYGLERELSEDLAQLFTKCMNFALCIPVEEKPGSFPLGLKQMMFFKKCEEKKKTAACIKKDLRRNPDMFELQGLDGMLDHYEDDDEKMIKVLILQHKYGEDEAAFFH